MKHQTYIAGKDAALETSIATMQHKLAQAGFHIEERSWLNPVEGIWSVHLRDHDCPLLFTNGKGATKLACAGQRAGRILRTAVNPLFLDALLPRRTACATGTVHDPRERWFPLPRTAGQWPKAAADAELAGLLQPGGQHRRGKCWSISIPATPTRGICALPYIRQRDGADRLVSRSTSSATCT